MKKIYNNWRSELLNEFAPSYGIDNEEEGIEQYITPSSDLIQRAIQDAIDANKGYHASGRPIDPNLLQGLLRENDVKELIDSMKGLREDDYLRKLTLNPVDFENATGRLNSILNIYRAAIRSEGKSIAVADVPLVSYMMNSVFMDTKRFQELKQNINNATEAFGLLLNSNRYKIIHAIRLFTGESVSTVRNPTEFNPERAEPMERDSIQKRKILRKILPEPPTAASAHFDNPQTSLGKASRSFMSIINHAKRGSSNAFINGITQIHSPEGKEKLTAYFDKVIEIAKSEMNNKELFITVYQKKGYIKMAELVGYSTNSRKFQEFLGSIDRIMSMVPIYQGFLEHYTNFLSTPEQEDYEAAKDILTKLAKKPSKQNDVIYRGMLIKGDLIPEGIKEGMEFDFYDISSWSKIRHVAESFTSDAAGTAFAPEGGDKKVIFAMKMKRGTYIEFYSAFTGEEEVITGGKVRITKVTPLAFELLVECEQI